MGILMNKLIGNRIRSIRRDRSLTQEALAEIAELNPKYISSIEIGKENPTIETLKKITDALKIKLSEVLQAEHEQTSETELKKIIVNELENANMEKLKMTAKLVRAILC